MPLQAKAVLLEDESAAASAHNATITRINNKTVQIFTAFRQNYYMVLGTVTTSELLVVRSFVIPPRAPQASLWL